METALNYYDRNNFFNAAIRQIFHTRLDQYKEGNLLKGPTQVLWQSSGILYNKAVEVASGDTIVVTPGDFLYLFKLNQLEEYVKRYQRNGLFYASLPAVWARVTNLDLDWLVQHVDSVHTGNLEARSGWRYDSEEIFRDYLRGYEPEKLYVPNIKRNKLIQLADPDSFVHLEEFCNDAEKESGVAQYIGGFHGFHVMTRKTFDTIGGFTEEWIHRAFEDDKMTMLGNRIAGQGLPSKFSVAWCGQYEWGEFRGPGYDAVIKATLPQVDPWNSLHPLPPYTRLIYLYSDIIPDHYIGSQVNCFFNTATPPVRLRS
jgi:hypothetical protein